MKTVRCDQWRETLISFVYGECESVEQERFESHLESCEFCRTEVGSFRSMQGALEEWKVLSVPRGFSFVPGRIEVRKPPSWWRLEVRPLLTVAIATTLDLVVGLSFVDFEFLLGGDGLMFRVGSFEEYVATNVKTGGGTDEDLVTKVLGDDSTTPQESLAREFSGQTLSDTNSEIVRAPLGIGGALELGRQELLNRLQMLVDQSEAAPERALAARLLGLAQEFDVQRRKDELRIKQEFDVQWRKDQLRIQQEFGDLEGHLFRVSGR